MKTFAIFSPIGPLTIKTHHQILCALTFGGKVQPYTKDPFEKDIIRQLNEYFLHQRKTFELPLQFSGTPFQEKVWRALAKIPYGETLTYQALADQLKTGARAIGNACRTNPFVVIIPCHRIVAKSGLGGFSGETKGEMMRIKADLLRLEKSDA